jgi:hypothetical protein
MIPLDSTLTVQEKFCLRWWYHTAIHQSRNLIPRSNYAVWERITTRMSEIQFSMLMPACFRNSRVRTISDKA